MVSSHIYHWDIVNLLLMFTTFTEYYETTSTTQTKMKILSITHLFPENDIDHSRGWNHLELLFWKVSKKEGENRDWNLLSIDLQTCLLMLSLAQLSWPMKMLE